jgi:hypothetical protein
MELRFTRLFADLRDTFTENLGLKFVSLAIAVLLFGFVRGSGNVQRSVDIPVTFVLPAAETGRPVLLSQLPDGVRVTVRGSPSVLGSLRGADLGPIQLDLRDGRKRQVRLEPDFIRLPAGATVVGFSPDVITLQWDVMVSRILPVRATVVGRLADRSRVGAIEVEPERVRVKGPSLYVDPMVNVHAEPVDATGLGVGRYERRVLLEAPRSGVDYDINRGVSVTFELAPVVSERRFERVPVTALGAARVNLRPPVIDVVVRGDPAVVDHMTPAQVVPVVELQAPEVLHGPVGARVEIRPLPDGVTVTARVPEEVLAVPVR